MAIEDHVLTDESCSDDGWKVELRDGPLPCSRSLFRFLFFVETKDRKLFWRWIITTPGASGDTVGATVVK